jgi:hypothetical protein
MWVCWAHEGARDSTTTIEILEGFRERSGGEVKTLGVDPINTSNIVAGTPIAVGTDPQNIAFTP